MGAIPHLNFYSKHLFFFFLSQRNECCYHGYSQGHNKPGSIEMLSLPFAEQLKTCPVTHNHGVLVGLGRDSPLPPHPQTQSPNHLPGKAKHLLLKFQAKTLFSFNCSLCFMELIKAILKVKKKFERTFPVTTARCASFSINGVSAN